MHSCVGLLFFLLQWEMTPLHLAAKGGHEEILKVLLEKCAQVDAKDRVRDKFSEKGKSLLSHIGNCLSL